MTVGQGHGRRLPARRRHLDRRRSRRTKPWSNPSASSSSYGGNPLASAAGLAALEIILKEDLVTNAERVGRVMLARLEAHEGEVPVRRRGARQGTAPRHRAGEGPRDARSRSTRTVTRALYQECLRRGLVAMTYSPSIRINPPLIIREDQALAGLAILDEALRSCVREHGLSSDGDRASAP